MFRATLFAVSFIALSNQALADEVTDTLTSALEAYEEGDIDYAIEELDYAKQLLKAMKTDELTAFLPEAPAGWTREVSTEMGAGLAMMGGGMGAEAEYTDGSDSFTITIMANNPMVTAFGAVVSNAALMGMKLERVGRQKFANDNGELSGLIDNRILIQASGADVDLMIKVLETMDFKALEGFSR